MHLKSYLAMVDWRTVFAFGSPFILYLLTLAPTIYNLDSAELTTAAATGGLVRATGYPLYLILGHLWSYIPIGDMGYRLNLFSAFNGALTILLAERILRRWQVGNWATAGALGLLATAPYFWSMSLIAEVYTLHTVLMAGLILLTLNWADKPTSTRLAWIGLFMGLSLGHHAATVLLIPGFIIFFLIQSPRQVLTGRAIGLATLTTLLGLSVYLYLPLRYQANPVFNYAGGYDANGNFIPLNLQTFEGFWWVISAKGFRGLMFAYTGAELWAETKLFGIQLTQSFWGIGLVPGFIGLFMLLRKHRQLGMLFLIIFICHVGFYLNYRVVDKQTMFLPAYLIWALWVGVGYQTLLTWAQGLRPVPQWQGETTLLKGIMIGMVCLTIGWNWQLVDLSDDWSTRTYGEAILSALEPNALFVGYWHTAPIVQYLQFVEGERPDVLAINRFMIANTTLFELIQGRVAERPIYIDTSFAYLYEIANVEKVGPIYRLTPHKSLNNQKRQ